MSHQYCIFINHITIHIKYRFPSISTDFPCFINKRNNHLKSLIFKLISYPAHPSTKFVFTCSFESMKKNYFRLLGGRAMSDVHTSYLFPL